MSQFRVYKWVESWDKKVWEAEEEECREVAKEDNKADQEQS